MRLRTCQMFTSVSALTMRRTLSSALMLKMTVSSFVGMKVASRRAEKFVRSTPGAKTVLPPLLSMMGEVMSTVAAGVPFMSILL